MAMLSLYEENIQVLKESTIKSKIWELLADINIQRTGSQVKWKFNQLLAKYKECINNNKWEDSHYD